MNTATKIGIGAAAAVLLWLWLPKRQGAAQASPQSLPVPPPPTDNAFLVDPAAFQPTSNNASSSNPVLIADEPVPIITPDNQPASGGGGNVKITFNTQRTFTPAAQVSANDVKVTADRIKITPTAVQQGPAASGSTQANMMATQKAAMAQQKPPPVIIGVGDLVWG